MSATDPAATTPPLARRLAGAGLIGALALAVWWPALGVGYLGDDHSVLAHGAALELLPYGRDETLGGWQSPMAASWRFFRPLVFLSAWIDSALGADPRISHGLQLAAHVVCAWLAAGLSLRLTRSGSVALAVGLVYAAFPTAVEPVAWISARGVLLCTLFTLAALRASAAALDAERPWGWDLAAAACAAAALAAKEPGLLLPAALGLWLLALARADGGRLGTVRRTVRRTVLPRMVLPLAAWGAVFAWRWIALDGSLGGYEDSPRQTETLAQFAAAVLSNLAAFTWPLSELAPARLPFAAAAGLAALGWGAAALVMRGARRELRLGFGFGALFAVLFLAPSVGYPQGGFDAPGLRHQLSSLAGIALAWVAALTALFERVGRPRAMLGAIALLVLGAGAAARVHVRPFLEASPELGRIRTGLRELPARALGVPVVAHGLPTARGPCQMAPGLLPALFLEPFHPNPQAARNVRLVHQLRALSGEVDGGLAQLLCDPQLASFAWDAEAARFEPGGWPFGLGALRARVETLDLEGAPPGLAVAGLALPMLAEPGVRALAALQVGDWVEVEAGLGPPFGVFGRAVAPFEPRIARGAGGQLERVGGPPSPGPGPGARELLLVGPPAVPRGLGSVGALCIEVREVRELASGAAALPLGGLDPAHSVQLLSLPGDPLGQAWLGAPHPLRKAAPAEPTEPR